MHNFKEIEVFLNQLFEMKRKNPDILINHVSYHRCLFVFCQIVYFKFNLYSSSSTASNSHNTITQILFLRISEK